MPRPLPFLVVAAALAFSGPTARLEAQTVQIRSAASGWIGVSLDFRSDRTGRVREIVVSDVSLDGPAQRAGLQPGDRILTINDVTRPDQLANLPAHLRLAAGDEVVMEIVRDGRRHTLSFEAERRPESFTATRTVRLTLEADSMVETWVRAMDSLRVELVAERNGDVRVRRWTSSDPGREDRVTVVTGRSDVAAGSGRAVRAPFEFFVFRGEAHDSLRREMTEVNRVAGELEELLRQRERQLVRRAGRSSALDLMKDEQFRRLSEALHQVEDRSGELETAMAEAARATAGLAYVAEPREAPEPEWERVREEPTEFRPLTPYLLGRNRVAGAEVIDLKPELARYFEVRGGVLVVDVAAGTPASMAGIVPGDVITRIDQVGVRSVEDLRFGVSMAGDTLPITLIRQGSSVQVLLTR